MDRTFPAADLVNGRINVLVPFIPFVFQIICRFIKTVLSHRLRNTSFWIVPTSVVFGTATPILNERLCCPFITVKS
jgi:hypothetical protein